MEKISRLHDEHQDIRSMLTELSDAIDAPAEVDLASFVVLLQQLREDLREHFEFEENGGLFTDITERRPNLDRRVAQLLRQHVSLSSEFDHVVDMAKAGKPVAEMAPPLREAIAGLREHERVETDLVQEALLTDIGVGD